MAIYGAGAGAGAEIMDKVGAGAENKKIRLRNTDRYYRIYVQLVAAALEASLTASCRNSGVMRRISRSQRMKRSRS